MKEIPSLKAQQALDHFFLDTRCRLLDLAAALDRIGRGEGADLVSVDLRMTRIKAALEIILKQDSGRAEAVQNLFSQEYDPNWNIPNPRY
jgi:hypothetical protein